MSHSISIDAVQLLATASPSPYWDDLAMKLEVLVEEPGSDGPLITALEGRLGDCGSGGIIDVRRLLANGGVPWRVELPPLSDGTLVALRVTIVNVRNLDDLSVERFLAKIGLIAAEVAAFHFAPAPKKEGAKIALHALQGGIGFGLDKLLEELLKDPPKCSGRVFSETKALTGAGIKAKPFKGVPDERYFKGVFTDTIVQSDSQSPGEGCGTPNAIVTFSVHHSEPKLFGPSIGEIKTKSFPVVELGLSKIYGPWADDPFVPYPRVGVIFAPSNKQGMDLVDVTVREALEHGTGEVVVNKPYPQRQAVLASRFKPGKNVYGVRNFISSKAAAAANSIDAFVSATAPGGSGGSGSVTLASSPAGQKFQPGPVTQLSGTWPFDPTMAISQFLESAPISVAIEELQHQTMTIFLPNGIVLSCWLEALDQKGAKPELVIRYSRPGNAFATHTDVWLSRPRPVK